MAISKTFQMASSDYSVKELLVKAGYSALDKESVLKPDFVVFPGGADVSPSLYSAKKEPRTFPDKAKDLEEITAWAAATLYDIPMVGICRGIQFLHVMSGGTLEQHINGHCNGPHNVIGKGGKVFTATSTHHQCVNREEAFMYEDVLFAEDGTVEFVLSKLKNWGGVQWHPEYKSASEDCIEVFLELVKTLTEGSF